MPRNYVGLEEKLSRMVSIPTVAGGPYEIARYRQTLRELFPHLFRQAEEIPVWRGAAAEARRRAGREKPVLFSGHMDVVAAPAGGLGAPAVFRRDCQRGGLGPRLARHEGRAVRPARRAGCSPRGELAPAAHRVSLSLVRRGDRRPHHGARRRMARSARRPAGSRVRRGRHGGRKLLGQDSRPRRAGGRGGKGLARNTASRRGRTAATRQTRRSIPPSCS